MTSTLTDDDQRLACEEMQNGTQLPEECWDLDSPNQECVLDDGGVLKSCKMKRKSPGFKLTSCKGGGGVGCKSDSGGNNCCEHEWTADIGGCVPKGHTYHRGDGECCTCDYEY